MDARKPNETSPLLPPPAVTLTIQPTLQDYANDGLRILRKAKWQRNCDHYGGLSLSTLFSLLSAAGFVFCVYKLITTYPCGTEPELLASYNGKEVAGFPPDPLESTCGEMYPLSDIDDYYSKIPHNYMPDNTNKTDVDLWTMTLQCYNAARYLSLVEFTECLRPIYIVFSIAGGLACLIMGAVTIHNYRNPKDCIKDIKETDTLYAAATKLEIDLSPNQKISDALNEFEKKLAQINGESCEVNPRSIFSHQEKNKARDDVTIAMRFS